MMTPGFSYKGKERVERGNLVIDELESDPLLAGVKALKA